MDKFVNNEKFYIIMNQFLEFQKNRDDFKKNF